MAVRFTIEEQEKVAAENMNLVHHVIKGININGYNYDDIFDAGQFGYAKAIKTFDKSQDVQFSTYACNCIRNEILGHLKRERKYLDTVSINKESTSESGKVMYLEEIIPDKKQVETEVFGTYMVEKLFDCMKELTDEEIDILKYHYGLFGEKRKKQTEIARKMNLSQGTISKIEDTALKKLKLYMSLDRA